VHAELGEVGEKSEHARPATVATSSNRRGYSEIWIGRLPRLEARFASGAGQSPNAGYLRAAQAYMLISMPTGTSTIFGVFQAIRVSQAFYGAMFAPKQS
jgi:hypothetical protein